MKIGIRLTVGTTVKAFYPGMVGVVKEGTITKIGSKYIYIDFGDLLGTKRVLSRDIVAWS
jgi:hypothetical protein